MDDEREVIKQRRQINIFWRLIATTFGFILFGSYGLFILSLLWFTLLRLVVWNEAKRIAIAQKSISFSFKIFLWIVKSLGIIDYQFYGLEKLKQDKKCLIVANHPSLLDVVLLASVMPRCDCLVKGALLQNIFISGIIKTAGYILNQESEKILPQCQQILANGGRILIFPEGTRSVPNEPIKLQRGAANIALRCHADLRVIHIQCNPPLLFKKQKWYRIPYKKPCFTITIGEKIAINEFSEFSTTIAARKLTQRLTSIFNEKSEII